MLLLQPQLSPLSAGPLWRQFYIRHWPLLFKKKKKMPGNHCRSGKLSISEAVLRNSNLDFMPGREAPPSLSFPFCQVGVENPAMRIKEARNTLCLTWGRYTGKGCLPPPLLPPS